MAHFDDRELARHYGFYWGKVVNNADPERRGRCRIDVPGIHDDLKWAVPVGFPGAGGTPYGAFAPPPMSAQVLVGFVQGDIDEPFYFCGPPAVGKVPDEVINAAPGSEIVAFQTSTFQVTVIDTATEKKFKIGTRDGTSYIELDAIDGSVSIKGYHYLILDAPLIATQPGRKVQIGNRVVLAVGSPI